MEDYDAANTLEEFPETEESQVRDNLTGRMHRGADEDEDDDDVSDGDGGGDDGGSMDIDGETDR